MGGLIVSGKDSCDLFVTAEDGFGAQIAALVIILGVDAALLRGEPRFLQKKRVNSLASTAMPPPKLLTGAEAKIAQ